MRVSLLSAALLSAMFASGAAFADQTSGVIKSVDDATRTVTLSDGAVYSFADSMQKYDMLGGYGANDHVTIVWDMNGTAKEVQSISPDFAVGVTGKITAIDTATNSVTLDNRTTYSFQNTKGEKTDIGGYKMGDKVSIVGAKEGNAFLGRSIAVLSAVDVTGKVKMIDVAAETVTLDNGTTYAFHRDSGNKIDLGGFKAGDMVKIVGSTAGNSHWGETISPANG